jgi:hypothetical protein
MAKLIDPLSGSIMLERAATLLRHPDSRTGYRHSITSPRGDNQGLQIVVTA